MTAASGHIVTRKALMAAALAALACLAIEITLAERCAHPLEGERCRSTSTCSQHELCVADTLASTWGTCRRLKVLP